MALDNIKTYIIGIILGIAVIMSGVFIIGSFAAEDNTLDSHGDIGAFNRTLALSQNVTTGVQNIEGEIDDVSNSNLGWIDALFRSAFQGLKTVKTSMGFATVAASDSARLFGIEEALPIIAIILLVVSIIIMISIYEAITRQ